MQTVLCGEKLCWLNGRDVTFTIRSKSITLWGHSILKAKFMESLELPTVCYTRPKPHLCGNKYESLLHISFLAQWNATELIKNPIRIRFLNFFFVQNFLFFKTVSISQYIKKKLRKNEFHLLGELSKMKCYPSLLGYLAIFGR